MHVMAVRGCQQRAAVFALLVDAVSFLEAGNARPIHVPGVTVIPSFLATTLIQSSVRPIMMVHTWNMLSTGLPSFSRRFMARYSASATAIACGTVKQTVALMFTPL